jgi:hypothetical protein
MNSDQKVPCWSAQPHHKLDHVRLHAADSGIIGILTLVRLQFHNTAAPWSGSKAHRCSSVLKKCRGTLDVEAKPIVLASPRIPHLLAVTPVDRTAPPNVCILHLAVVGAVVLLGWCKAMLRQQGRHHLLWTPRLWLSGSTVSRRGWL